MAGMQTYLELFCSVFLFFYKEKTCSNFYLTQGTGHLFAGASSYERANSSHQSFATCSPYHVLIVAKQIETQKKGKSEILSDAFSFQLMSQHSRPFEKH